MSLLARSALLVDPDAAARLPVARRLARLGFDVHEHETHDDARVRLGLGRFDLIVADLHVLLADDARFFAEAARGQPGVPIVALTFAGSLAECVQVIRAGAIDCLVKPLRPHELEATVGRVLARQAHRPAHAEAAGPAPVVIAASRAMREVVRLLVSAARGDAAVLVSGERGTGKNVLARLVHEVSPRAAGPLVTVRCGALPEGLIEPELFGHGDFPGRLAEAAGGTIVLDDVSELPGTAQARLTRVLAAGVAARVVAVARGDLEAAVAAGRFRPDLLGRLGEVRVLAPPLRERRADVVLLAQHFLAAIVRRHGRPLELARETLAALREHDWPLNVRELEHTIERLAALATTPRLGIDLLPPRLLRRQEEPPAVDVASAAPPEAAEAADGEAKEN